MRYGDGGSWYYGGWRRGKKHGAGVELSAGTGCRFEGLFRDGLRDNSFPDALVRRQTGPAIAPRVEGAFAVRLPENAGRGGAAGGGAGEGGEGGGAGGAGVGQSQGGHSDGSWAAAGKEDERSAGVLRNTQPARYFDPAIHAHVMVRARRLKTPALAPFLPSLGSHSHASARSRT